jgi:hypothetical protein
MIGRQVEDRQTDRNKVDIRDRITKSDIARAPRVSLRDLQRDRRLISQVLRLTRLSWQTRKASVLGTVSAHQVFTLAHADSSRLAC